MLINYTIRQLNRFIPSIIQNIYIFKTTKRGKNLFRIIFFSEYTIDNVFNVFFIRITFYLRILSFKDKINKLTLTLRLCTQKATYSMHVSLDIKYSFSMNIKYLKSCKNTDIKHEYIIMIIEEFCENLGE